MKYILSLLLFVSSLVYADQRENIYATASLGPTWSVAPAMRKVLEVANKSQDKYNFIFEFRPGGEQLIAIRHTLANPHDRFVMIGAKFVDYINNGTLNKNDFEIIHSMGDACWPLISNIGDEKLGVQSLKNKDIFAGAVGFGTIAHMTTLSIAEQYNVNVTYVQYKSTVEALFAVTAENGANVTIDRISNFENMKIKNPKLQMLGMSCPHRMPNYPNIKTLKEQNIDVPSIFHFALAPKEMKAEKRKEISNILNAATLTISVEEFHKLCECTPPILNNISNSEYFEKRIDVTTKLLKKYEKQLKGS